MYWNPSQLVGAICCLFVQLSLDLPDPDFRVPRYNVPPCGSPISCFSIEHIEILCILYILRYCTLTFPRISETPYFKELCRLPFTELVRIDNVVLLQHPEVRIIQHQKLSEMFQTCAESIRQFVGDVAYKIYSMFGLG